jgi:hypothetical protein
VSKAKVAEYHRRGKLPPLAFTIAAGPLWDAHKIETFRTSIEASKGP